MSRRPFRCVWENTDPEDGPWWSLKCRRRGGGGGGDGGGFEQKHGGVSVLEMKEANRPRMTVDHRGSWALILVIVTFLG